MKVTGGASYYVSTEIVEDTSGKVSIDKEYTSMKSVPDTGLDGGWAQCEDPKLTADEKTAFTKAINDKDGLSITPIAKVSTQVVAGINYLLICEAKLVVPDAKTGYGLIPLNVSTSGAVTVDKEKSSIFFMNKEDSSRS